jgi:outer membrane immunogenic protein
LEQEDDAPMKSLAIIAALVTFAATPSLAADIAVKASPVPSATVYSWSGFYAGGSFGGGWADPTTNNSVLATFCGALAGCPALGTAIGPAVPPQFKANSDGVIGGIQTGYNFQSGLLVYGVEADFSGGRISGSGSGSLTVPVVGAPNTITVSGTGTQVLDTFGTVRLRVGATVSERLLAYATGGFAYAHASSNLIFNEVIGGGCVCGPSPTTTATASGYLAGWTAGGGLEWMLTQRWSVKGEYLYYDLGSLTVAPPQLLQLNAAAVPFVGVNTSSTAAFRGNIVRAGFNYRF